MSGRSLPETTVRTLLQRATALLRQGHWPGAEQACAQVLAAQPGHLGALALLGVALEQSDQLDRAEAVFRELTARAPQQPANWVNHGTVLRALGRLDEALKSYTTAALRGENSASFLYNLGLLQLDLGRFTDALDTFGRAWRQAPQDAEIGYFRAQCLYECVHNDEALATARAVLALAPAPELSARLGLLLLHLGDAVSAAQAMARVNAAARTPSATLRLALYRERTNELEPARQLLGGIEPAALSDEDREDLLAVQARLAERVGDLPSARRSCEALLDRIAQEHRRHPTLFALAKILDAAGDSSGAWSTLQAAHASQVEFLRRTAPEIVDGREPMAITRYGVQGEDVASWDQDGAPDAAHSPVFVLGFPRSGTTLLEQMLDAHPQVRAMDEQPFLQRAIEAMQAAGATYPERLAGLSAAQCEEIRRGYWARVGEKLQLAPGERLVDKNPLNQLRLAAIARLFPQARVILAVRHPCDVILSCFMQHFRAPDFAMVCSTLERLAEGYARTFDFWYEQAKFLHPAAFELRYESFVADVAGHAGALSDFLQLPRSDAMLDIAGNARARGYISTPSYSQVVQPVTARAVGRWQRYRAHFEPLLPRLSPYLERWGYG